MTARHVARLRGLLAELAQVLDEAEAEQGPPRETRPRRRRITPAPKVTASPEVVDKMRRVLRAKGLRL